MELYYAYLRLLIAFPLIIVLIYFVLRYLLPHCLPAWGAPRRIKVVERAPLTNRAFLYIVKVDDRYFLLAATINSITLLKELGENKEPSFAETLQQARAFGEPCSLAAVLQGIAEKGKGFLRRSSGKDKEKFLTSLDKKSEGKRK